MSARVCGCDNTAGWVCERHREEAMKDTVPATQEPPFDQFPIGPGGGGCGGTSVIITSETAKQEIRITDAKTGGQKGSKLARFALIPAEFLWALAEHYGLGARKYDDRNWERGYKWSLSVDALLRHLNQWLMGEDNDEETGSNHLIAVAWHACALFIFQRRNLGTNDVRSRNHDTEESLEDAILDAKRSFKCDPLSWCRKPVPQGVWICNRPRGHHGHHVAVIDERVLEHWL